MLKIKNLKKAFGSLTVTDDLSLTITAGARHCIIGPNGAGKSTLVNLIAGDLLQDSGDILFNDNSITKFKQWQRATLGLTRAYQIATGFPSASLIENLLLALNRPKHIRSNMWRDRFSFFEDIQHATDILRRVGFNGDLTVPASSLSYGEMKQLELAMALSTNPKLLILDEPLAGVSREESSQIVSIIKNIPDDITLVVIEHDMDAVFQIADTITVLVEGRELVTGSPDTIRSSTEVRTAYLGDH